MFFDFRGAEVEFIGLHLSRLRAQLVLQGFLEVLIKRYDRLRVVFSE